MASFVYFLNFLCSVNSQNHFFVSLKSVVSIDNHFCLSISRTSVDCNVSTALLCGVLCGVCGVLCGVHIPAKSSENTSYLCEIQQVNHFLASFWFHQPHSDLTSLSLISYSHISQIFNFLLQSIFLFIFLFKISLFFLTKIDFEFFYLFHFQSAFLCIILYHFAL